MTTTRELFDERFDNWVRLGGPARARLLVPLYDLLSRPAGAPPDVDRAVALARRLIRRGRSGVPVPADPVGTDEPGLLFLHLSERGWFTSSGRRSLPSPFLRRLDAHPRALWTVIADGLLTGSEPRGPGADAAFAAFLRPDRHDAVALADAALEESLLPSAQRRAMWTYAETLLGSLSGLAPDGSLTPEGRAAVSRALRASVLASGPASAAAAPKDLPGVPAVHYHGRLAPAGCEA